VNPNAHAIIGYVCTHFGMQPWMLLGRDRHQDKILARFVAMYLVRQLLHLSYPQIGEMFGRDHTTVINGVRRVMLIPRGPAHVKAILDTMTKRAA
jgi:chromosomal replication initiator protein